jgi:membrane protease YdiL (CAAX protease family)
VGQGGSRAIFLNAQRIVFPAAVVAGLATAEVFRRSGSIWPANNTEPSWLNLLTAMFYGGITEEILMRWGLMSLLVWIAWKGLKQGVTLPSQGIYQGAIVLAALVFGLLHLPATAAIVPLTPVAIFRALLLNGIGGIAFGWLFWQYSLEAAMLAHISVHAFSFALRLLLARFF